jgi:hypothetical protein
MSHRTATRSIAVPLPASRVARVEAAHRRAERQEDARREAEAAENLRRHQQRAAELEEAKRALASPWASLRAALEWYRTAWQAALPIAMHTHDVEPLDAWGGPQWTARFKGYLFGHPRDGVGPEADDIVRDPLRVALAAMARGSLFERCGAVYLFRLGCLDFDPISAGLRMAPPITHDYAGWYCETAIGRLRERMAQAQRRHEESWQFRALSESQARAEAGR